MILNGGAQEFNSARTAENQIGCIATAREVALTFDIVSTRDTMVMDALDLETNVTYILPIINIIMEYTTTLQIPRPIS